MSRSSSSRGEGGKVRGTDSDRIDDADVWQLPDLAQPVDGRGADAELPGDLSYGEQPVAPAVEDAQVARGRRGRARRRSAHVVRARVDLGGLRRSPRPVLVGFG